MFFYSIIVVEILLDFNLFLSLKPWILSQQCSNDSFNMNNTFLDILDALLHVLDVLLVFIFLEPHLFELSLHGLMLMVMNGLLLFVLNSLLL